MGGGSLPNFNFFNVNLQMWQQNRKIHYSDCLDTNFRKFSDIILRVIRHRKYNLLEFSTRMLFPLNNNYIGEENINFIHTTNDLE